MKLREEDKIEVDSIGQDMLDLKSTISEENIPLVLSLVSKGIYSNPIGSLIRELTSNCIDANTELGVQKPILINIKYDYENSNHYIEFVDKGIGMSEQRIRDIYTSFFSSTKRHTNSLIGGFGLGSKSPLSYTDIFYITTIFDNIKYEYVYFKEGSEYILSQLNKYPVLEKSGTTIKIDIKDNDLPKFVTELKNQLSYFKDVFVNIQGSSYNYNNEFKIYEGKYFKFKSEDRSHSSLHLTLGQVSYPIDFNILNIDEINLPIAVKFDVGELKPTLERENIQYDEESIKLIKERINLVLSELREYFKDQSFEITDLKTYLSNRGNIPHLYFNKELSHGFKAVRELISKNEYSFVPLQDIKIPDDYNIFFMYKIYRVSGNTFRECSVNGFITDWLNNRAKILIKDKGDSSTWAKDLFWINQDTYQNQIFVFVRNKIDYNTSKSALNISSYNHYRYINSFYHKLSLRDKSACSIGNSKLIYRYVDVITNYIKSISTGYNDIPQEIIDNYIEQRKHEQLEQRKLQKEKVIYNGRESIQLSNLLKYKYIFFKIKGENIELEEYRTLMFYLNGRSWRQKDFKFISISNSQYQKIKKFDNIKHIHSIFDVPEFQNYFGKIKLSYYIENQFNSFLDYNLSPYYCHLSNFINNFINKYKPEKYYYSYSSVINQIIKRKFPIPNSCKEITSALKELNKVRSKLSELNIVYNSLDYIENIPSKHISINLDIPREIKMTKLSEDFYKRVKSINNKSNK
jgi:hypothetical protein